MTQNETTSCQQIDPELTRASSVNVPAGVVYFVRSGDGIKIGFATRFKRRFHALQTASEKPLEVLAVIPGLNEYDVHQRFAHLRIRGEWFRAEKEILDFIEYAKLKFGEDSNTTRERAPQRPAAPKRKLTKTQRDLGRLVAAYESADAYNKPAIAFVLRKVFTRMNAQTR